MNTLLRLLLLERLRKLRQHYGLQGYISAGTALILLVWAVSAVSAQWIQRLPRNSLDIFILLLWSSWVFFAVATGKDLSWQIPLDRLRIFPSPGFLQLYLSSFALGFLSFPILAGMIVALYWTYIRQGLQLENAVTLLLGYLLFASSVRLSASLGRAIIFFNRSLSSSQKILSGTTVLFLLSTTAVSAGFSGREVLHPAKLFSCILAGHVSGYSLICMAAWAILLLTIDAILRFNLNYAGAPGALSSSNTLASASFLLDHAIWPSPIFRIGVLGWLRNRSALFLFLWGNIYSFFWTYFSRPSDSEYFIVFIFMNLLFHAYLRGNLLGIDRGGAWIYYRFPMPIECILKIKSLSLSFLQICMISSLLIAGILRANVPFALADWCVILSYACSGILFGEICGFFISIRWPESIDQTSVFDGGTSIGALMISAIQLLFLLIFMQASEYMQRHFRSIECYGILTALPLFLLGLRYLSLKIWVRKIMLNKSEVLLKKLLWN
jgi:hypothetical protein